MISKKIPEKDLQHALRYHFNYGYRLYSDAKSVPNAGIEMVNDVHRCLSGIPYPFLNAVLDCADWKGNWDDCITQQMKYFKKAKMPFVWFVDENTNQPLEQALLRRGFIFSGVFQGVVGVLDKPLSQFPRPKGYTFERAEGAKAIGEFNELICEIFGVKSPSKEMFHNILQVDSQKKVPEMYHWIARKEGRVVSAVTTLIKDQIVSFWNVATVPELRRQGLSTTLHCLALDDAVQKGCRIGTSYLMSEALAFGICQKLGYETKWRFNTFLAPH